MVSKADRRLGYILFFTFLALWLSADSPKEINSSLHQDFIQKIKKSIKQPAEKIFFSNLFPYISLEKTVCVFSGYTRPAEDIEHILGKRYKQLEPFEAIAEGDWGLLILNQHSVFAFLQFERSELEFPVAQNAVCGEIGKSYFRFVEPHSAWNYMKKMKQPYLNWNNKSISSLPYCREKHISDCDLTFVGINDE